eukprot:243122-Chlamydomonas_euryale.AAC.5
MGHCELERCTGLCAGDNSCAGSAMRWSGNLTELVAEMRACSAWLQGRQCPGLCLVSMSAACRWMPPSLNTSPQLYALCNTHVVFAVTVVMQYEYLRTKYQSDGDAGGAGAPPPPGPALSNGSSAARAASEDEPATKRARAEENGGGMAAVASVVPPVPPLYMSR